MRVFAHELWPWPVLLVVLWLVIMAVGYAALVVAGWVRRRRAGVGAGEPMPDDGPLYLPEDWTR